MGEKKNGWMMAGWVYVWMDEGCKRENKGSAEKMNDKRGI